MASLFYSSGLWFLIFIFLIIRGPITLANANWDKQLIYKNNINEDFERFAAASDPFNIYPNLKDDIKKIVEETVEKYSGINVIKKNIRDLGLDVENLRDDASFTNQKKNEQLTVQWLSNSIMEIRNEISELAKSYNSSVVLQQRQNLLTDISILQNDVVSLRHDIETVKAEMTKMMAKQSTVSQDLEVTRKLSHNTAAVVANLTDELRTSVSDWSRSIKYFRKKSKDNVFKRAVSGEENPLRMNVATKYEDNKEQEYIGKSRHCHHLVKQVDTLKSSLHELKASQNYAKHQMYILEKQIDSVVDSRNMRSADKLENRVTILEKLAFNASDVLVNVSSRLSGQEKFRTSLLELLEDVENLENKVDSTIPDIRREISKLEFSLTQTASTTSSIKEDLDNQRVSLKAMGESLSLLQDKMHERMNEVDRFKRAMEDVSTIKEEYVRNMQQKEHSQKITDVTEKSDGYDNQMLGVKEIMPLDLPSGVKKISAKKFFRRAEIRKDSPIQSKGDEINTFQYQTVAATSKTPVQFLIDVMDVHQNEAVGTDKKSPIKFVKYIYHNRTTEIKEETPIQFLTDIMATYKNQTEELEKLPAKLIKPAYNDQPSATRSKTPVQFLTYIMNTNQKEAASVKEKPSIRIVEYRSLNQTARVKKETPTQFLKDVMDAYQKEVAVVTEKSPMKIEKYDYHNQTAGVQTKTAVQFLTDIIDTYKQQTVEVKEMSPKKIVQTDYNNEAPKIKTETPVQLLKDTMERYQKQAGDIKGTSAVKIVEYAYQNRSSSEVKGESPVQFAKDIMDTYRNLSSLYSEYQHVVKELPKGCENIQGTSGLHLISPDGGSPILVYCERKTGANSSAYTTFQRRINGVQDFNKNWEEYATGFGSPDEEFWLGNEALHRLTKNNDTSLRVDFKDISGNDWYAEYNEFRVDAKDDGYRLHVAGYTGNASDALEYQNRMQFSTTDTDKDISNTNCAQNYEGGWWFSHCQHANLNGRYNLGLTWFDNIHNEWIAVLSSELKLFKGNVK